MPGGIHPPESVIATWPVPNYKDPVTQGKALLVLTIILSALGVSVVTARLYSRFFISRIPGVDDALALIALVFGLAMSVMIIYTNQRLGVGRHVWDVPTAWNWKNRLLIWCIEWCFILSTTSIKISILLFYKRLSAPFTNAFLIATWIGIIYNILYVISFGLALILQCRPIPAYWRQVDPSWLLAGHKYRCLDETTSLPASAGFSVLGDLYTTLLPLLLVYHLKMPGKQKAALYGLFCLGFFTVAAGSVRTYYLYFCLSQTYDDSWYLWALWFPTLLELYFAMIAASAPALKPFFIIFLVDPVRTRTRSGIASSSSYGASRDLPSHQGANSRLSMPFRLPFQRHRPRPANNKPHQESYLDVESQNTTSFEDSKSRYELTTTTTHPHTEPVLTPSADSPSLNPDDGTTTTATTAPSAPPLTFSRHPAITGGKSNLTPRGSGGAATPNPFCDTAADHGNEPLSSRVAALSFERERRHHSLSKSLPPTPETQDERRQRVIGNLDLDLSDEAESEPEDRQYDDNRDIGVATRGTTSRSSSRATATTTTTAPMARTHAYGYGATRPWDFVYDYGSRSGNGDGGSSGGGGDERRRGLGDSEARLSM